MNADRKGLVSVLSWSMLVVALLTGGCATLPESTVGQNELAPCLKIRPLPRSDVRSKI